MGDPSANYAPPITFLTVQKRHQTRLFPARREEGDRSGNVVPGTVVDSGICHPYEFDFFLNAHAGLQVSRAAARWAGAQPPPSASAAARRPCWNDGCAAPPSPRTGSSA